VRGTGEWTRGKLRDKNKICPVCGKEAVIKFVDETKKVVMFKHHRKLKGNVVGHFNNIHGKIVESFYHEVPY
jgi:ribosomal protein S27AE